MLRFRLHQRCAQQFCSLLEWQESQAVLQQSQQRAASTGSTAEKSVQYARDRKGFERNLAELRKLWNSERKEREARRAAAQEAEREQRAAAKAARAQQDAEAKEARKLRYQQKVAEEREIRMQAKAQRLRRQVYRDEILQIARDARREQLLKQSRNWITAETLDKRIQEALDNPSHLYPGEVVAPAWGEEQHVAR